MKKIYNFSYSLLLLAVAMLSSGSLWAQPCTSSNTCGGVEFTTFTAVGTPTGTGTVGDPYDGQTEIKICMDIQDYGEEGMNYLHGIFIRNIPDGATISNTSVNDAGGDSGVQPITVNPGAGNDGLSGTNWEFFATDDGIPPGQFPLQTANGPNGIGQGFIPYPGFYVTDGDGNPRDNFGDEGDSPGGIATPFETYTLDEFCFYVTLNPATASVSTWRPQVGISGDGSTGAHIIASVQCFITGFSPNCGGDGSGTVYYKGNGTPPASTSCTASNDCGSIEFTSFKAVGATTGMGTVADPYTGSSIEVQLCMDIQTYNEEALNYLHGVFIRNLPDGSTLSYTSANGASSGEQDVEIQPGPTGDATLDAVKWEFFATDDGIDPFNFPLSTAGNPVGDGDGFIPYPGFYVTNDDGNPRDNFGDEGSTPGGLATPETYNLDDFCFYVTLNPQSTDVESWQPLIGISGDGSTGQHTAPSTLCFLSDFVTRCGGGNDQQGFIHFAQSNAPAPLELTSFTGANEGKTNLIEWTTATERDVKVHILEKSYDGANFAELGSVEATNTTSNVNYSMVDYSPANTTYYRLRSIDYDGTENVSEVINIEAKIGVVTALNVHPVPTIDLVNVNYISKSTLSNATVTITDFAGRAVQTQIVKVETGANQFSVDLSNQTPGVYFLTIQNGNEVITQRVVKQ